MVVKLAANILCCGLYGTALARPPPLAQAGDVPEKALARAEGNADVAQVVVEEEERLAVHVLLGELLHILGLLALVHRKQPCRDVLDSPRGRLIRVLSLNLTILR